jgi:hypothetical protein
MQNQHKSKMNLWTSNMLVTNNAFPVRSKPRNTATMVINLNCNNFRGYGLTYVLLQYKGKVTVGGFIMTRHNSVCQGTHWRDSALK